MLKAIKEGSKTFIPGIPKMSWDTGEMCEFASAFVRSARCIEINVDYSYITGLSGAAFRFVLDEQIWNPEIYRFQKFTADPLEPISAVCDAVGIAHRYFTPSTFNEDRHAIVSSINSGIPIIAFGVVGPSDAVIITGFDDDGDILLGWSTFQDIPDDHDIPHDTTGYFRKPEWYGNLRGYVLLQPNKQAVDKYEVIVNALKRITRIIETPKLPGRICGIEALSAWETILRNNDYFDINAETFAWRYLCFSIYTTMLLDQLCATSFLNSIVPELPMCETMIKTASNLCRHNAATIKSAQSKIPDNFSSEAQTNLKNPRVREEYAGLIADIHNRTETLCEILHACIEQTR